MKITVLVLFLATVGLSEAWNSYRYIKALHLKKGLFTMTISGSLEDEPHIIEDQRLDTAADQEPL